MRERPAVPDVPHKTLSKPYQAVFRALPCVGREVKAGGSEILMRKMRAAPKRRLSGYCKAFIVLLVLFFAAGFAFLGSFKGTGKAFTYVSGGENTVVYNLNMKEGQSKLGAVYINVGNIYTEPGKDITVKVYRSTSSSGRLRR